MHCDQVPHAPAADVPAGWTVTGTVSYLKLFPSEQFLKIPLFHMYDHFPCMYVLTYVYICTHMHIVCGQKRVFIRLPVTGDTRGGEPPWGAGINPGTSGTAASINC